MRDSELTIRVGRSVGAIDLMSDEMMRGVGRARPRESQGGLWSTAHCAGPHVACVFWARITLGWSQDHWAVTPCCDIWALFQGWIISGMDHSELTIQSF